MIALRGILRKDEDAKWVWKGIWAFGNALPEDEQAALEAKNPSVRPFEYSFDQPQQASSVLVPSMNEEKEKESEDDKGESGAPKATAGEKVGESASREEAKPDQRGGGSEEMQIEESKIGDELQKKGEEPSTETEAKKPQAEGGDATKKSEGSDKAEPKDTPATETKKAPPVTFATTLPGEPPFTDASAKYAEKCPPGGSWKGSFETATVSDSGGHYYVLCSALSTD